MGKIVSLQDKLNFITKYTSFTVEDLLNLPIEIFDKIFMDVKAMREAIFIVERDTLLYKKE